MKLDKVDVELVSTPICPAGLSVVKSPKAGTFLPGSQVTFTMIVNNPSDHVDTNVHLHDQLPGNGGLHVGHRHSESRSPVSSSTSNVMDCDLGTPGAGRTT